MSWLVILFYLFLLARTNTFHFLCNPFFSFLLTFPSFLVFTLFKQVFYFISLFYYFISFGIPVTLRFCFLVITFGVGIGIGQDGYVDVWMDWIGLDWIGWDGWNLE